MLGLGLGLGFSRAKPFDAHAEIVRVLGSALLGHWRFDDATLDGSENATALPGLVTGTDLALDGARVIPTTLVNGRRFTNVTASTGRALRLAAAWRANTVFAVLRVPALPFTSAAYCVCSDAINEPKFQATNASSNWSTAAGFTHRRNGVSTEAAATGVNVYRATKAAPDWTGIRLCGAGAAYTGLDFVGGIGSVVAAGAVTADQAAEVEAILSRSYGV
jgi:hypothetical protein